MEMWQYDKFHMPKGDAECEHSEDVSEADQRRKLALSTWSDIVNLSVRPDDELLPELLRGAMGLHHQDEVSHCPTRVPSHGKWGVHLYQLHTARTW